MFDAAGVRKVSEEEVTSLAAQLNSKMAELHHTDAAGWYKMFKLVDDDNSGKISFREFERLVRQAQLQQ